VKEESAVAAAVCCRVSCLAGKQLAEFGGGGAVSKEELLYMPFHVCPVFHHAAQHVVTEHLSLLLSLLLPSLTFEHTSQASSWRSLVVVALCQRRSCCTCRVTCWCLLPLVA
jgi:hypothetical protein